MGLRVQGPRFGGKGFTLQGSGSGFVLGALVSPDQILTARLLDLARRPQHPEEQSPAQHGRVYAFKQCLDYS